MERNLTKKAERIRDKEILSNVVTNKMVIVFLVLVAAIIALVKVGDSLTMLNALPYLQIVFAVLTAAALAWYIVCAKKKVDARYKVFSAPLLLGLSAAGLFASLTYTLLGGVFRIVLSLLAFTLLFFVYQIYSMDFFACSVATVTCSLSVAAVNSVGVTAALVPVVNIFAVLVSAAATVGGGYFVYRLLHDKKLVICGKQIAKPVSSVPAAIYTVMAVGLAAVIFSLIFGYVLYCVAAIVVTYFVVAIIYTVKLM